MRAYKQSIKVQYNQVKHNTYINTLEGKVLVRKNDYIITGIDGEVYPVSKVNFKRHYNIIDNEYAKSCKIRRYVYKMNYPIKLCTHRGILKGKKGDYLIISRSNSWIVDNQIFHKTYKF